MVWMSRSPEEQREPRCTLGRRLWTAFCWETSCPAIRPAHPSWKRSSFNGSSFCQKGNPTSYAAEPGQEHNESRCSLDSTFLRSQSSRASEGCAGQTCPTHRGPNYTTTFRGHVESIPQRVKAVLVAKGGGG